MTWEYEAIDLYAGIGGWDLALHHFGINVIGLEFDEIVCQTRKYFELDTLAGDVSQTSPEAFRDMKILVASPPCQTFSTAGGGSGRRVREKICNAILDRKYIEYLHKVDDRTKHVIEVGKWVQVIQPEIVIFEQVRNVLPVWRAWQEVFSDWGYSGWVATVNMADYGLPQTRKRSILCMSKNGATFPEPTNIDNHITMAETFPIDRDWLDTRLKSQFGYDESLDWPLYRPSTTVMGRDLVQHPGATKNKINNAKKSRNDGYQIVEEEGLLLQSFPSYWYPKGNKKQRWTQIGNAMPPLMAKIILEQNVKS